MQVIKEGLLKVDPGLLLWTIITFIVLLLILWKAAWRPIVDALDARAEKVRGDIDNADKARQDAEKILEEHKALMANAKNESESIIAAGKEAAEKVRNDIINKAGLDAKEIAERSKREIIQAKNKALDEIKVEVITIATEIASKIIKKNLNPDDQVALAEGTLNKMGTVQ